MAKDPIAEAFRHHGDSFDHIFNAVGFALWEHRVELFSLGALAAGYGGLVVATHRSFVAAGAIFGTVLVVLAFLDWKLGGSLVRNRLARARVRRRWYRALRHAGLPLPVPRQLPITQHESFHRAVKVDRCAVLTRIRSTEVGYRGRLRLNYGITFNDLRQRQEKFSSHMGLRSIHFDRDRENAQRGTVTFVTRDPLKAVRETKAPVAMPDESVDLTPLGGGKTFWDPILLGHDEIGNDVTLSLVERNLFIGGLQGSGKSVAMSLILARAALDPDVKLFLIDGGLLEFAEWEKCSEGGESCAHELSEAIPLLDDVRGRLQVQREKMRDRGIRNVTKEFPLHVIFVDELAFFTANPDKKQSNEFSIRLLDILQRGRAAGFMIVAAMQKPEGSIIWTNLRDLFAFKLAFRSTTPQASDTILGQGMAAAGFNAQDIHPEQPGVGYLLAGSGIPQRIRTNNLDDQGVRAYANLAYRRRRQRS